MSHGQAQTEHKQEGVESNHNDNTPIMKAHTPIINGNHNGHDKMDEDNDDDADHQVLGDGQRIYKLREENEEDIPIQTLLNLLVDYKVTDWEHNIFTRGSYSYLPKGALYNHCKALQEYDGNGVYFCGEATSVSGFECVDGAHETGFEVAKEIHIGLQKGRYKNDKHNESQKNKRR